MEKMCLCVYVFMCLCVAVYCILYICNIKGGVALTGIQVNNG